VNAFVSLRSAVDKRFEVACKAASLMSNELCSRHVPSVLARSSLN
jgi:hypothetical protein